MGYQQTTETACTITGENMYLRWTNEWMKDVTEEPIIESKALQASLPYWSSVKDITQLKTEKNGLHERWRKPLLTKKNTKISLTFTKNILMISQDFWKIFCVLMRQKLQKLFGGCVSFYVWPKTNRVSET